MIAATHPTVPAPGEELNKQLFWPGGGRIGKSPRDERRVAAGCKTNFWVEVGVTGLKRYRPSSTVSGLAKASSSC